jgi:hypothetical protein
MLKMFGERGWSMFMGYGRRWAVETAFPTYKYNTLINIHT